MLFSILIANYNNGVFFKECYESIIAQTYNNWEAIIVDDGSADNSVNIIRQLTENDKRFKLYQNEKNMGCGYTKRKCVELATGSICGFLDPDDTLTPDALQAMINTHLQHLDAALVYSRCYIVNDNFTKIISNGDDIMQVKNKDNSFLNQDGNIGHFTTFKKSFYNKTTGIDTYLKRAIDQDLYLKLYETGEAVFLNQILYHYRIHRKGISTFDNKSKARFWFWVVMMNTAKRRNLNLENQFCKEFIKTEDCWISVKDVRANPGIILKKLFIILKKKISLS